jgi:hypothetical protein
MLTARSVPECHLYMNLHPCSCGEPAFDTDHFLESGPDDELIAVYQGPCARCGLPRRFEFALDPELPPPPPAYGGAAPSSIICPGQFAIRADTAAGSVPVDADTEDSRAGEIRRALAEAVAAQSEILKFVPGDADAVPAEAFTSAEGRALYASEPGRFRRARLEAVLDVYREALSRVS